MSKVLVLVSAFTAFVLGAHLPSNFGTCKLSDNACLKEKVQDAIEKLGVGNKELQIPEIDPFHLGSVSIEPGNGPVNMLQKYIDIAMSGYSKSKIVTFSLDLDKCTLYAVSLTPHVRSVAHYVYKGHLLLFPLNAEGDFAIEIDNLEVVTHGRCEKFQKDGEDYIRFKDMIATFKNGKTTIKVNNILNKASEISAAINNRLNEDPQLLVDSFRPSFTAIWNSSVVDIANRIFTTVPLKEIFLDYGKH